MMMRSAGDDILLRRLRHPSLGQRGLGVRLGGGQGMFRPEILFTNGEQGVWFDPSDLSCMFQNSAGNTPAAVGQPVGLNLDKSKGLALGPELHNTVVATPGLNGAATAASYNSVTGVGSVTAVDGSNYSYLVFNGMTPGWYKISYTNNGPGNFLNIRDGGPGGTVWGGANSGETKTEYIRLTGTALCFRLAVSGTATFTIFSLRSIAGNHRYQTTAASRPVLRQSGNLYYLEYDGVDDFMLTNAIDFSAANKIAVWAGVRKIGAASACIAETSADVFSNVGSFLINANQGGGNNYAFYGKGSTFAGLAASTFTAPVTNVLSVAYDISGAAEAQEIFPRVNAAVPTLASATGSSGAMGSGNFGNHVLYTGRRAGTTLPFNGYEYGLIVRGGTHDPSLINRTEAWMNGKTGAY